MQKALVIFFAVLSTALVNGDVWHYPNEESNGVLSSKEDWGGMCSTGRRQSPVDLAKAASIKGKFSKFSFDGYDSSLKAAVIVNNGHSIQVNTIPGPVFVKDGGLPGTYIFDQMHFHWASEHTIDGNRFALELHMVHHEKRYDTLNKAAEAKNGIAVLGILFHITETPNPMIEKMLTNTATIFEEAGKNITYKEKLVLTDFLPRDLEPFFRYEGSLTTPSCGEAVIWTVFERSIGISANQLERFKGVHDAEGHELTHNYRNLQPLNSRSLIYVQAPETFHYVRTNSYNPRFGVNYDNSAGVRGFSLPLMIIASFILVVKYLE